MMTALLVPAGNDLIGRLIGVCEHDTVVHVAADLGDGWTIAEEEVGCWARPIEQFTNPAIIKYPLPLNTVQESGAKAWLRSQVGQRYSYETIALDAINLILKLHLADRDDHRYVCSSLVAVACAKVGLTLFPGKDPLAVTPADWHALSRASVNATLAPESASS